MVSVQVITEECAEPGEGRVFLGSELTLNCVLPPSVPPIVPGDTQWFRDDTVPWLITQNFNRRLNGTRLVFQGAAAVDSADYFCRVSNGPLSRDSATVNIAVISKCSDYILCKGSPLFVGD